ncbi:MAG: endolytic transglycosylase MltG [Alphaproteobacteria bacterium]|nr:endolytic transglycosylase MltG [Alphaproteobacteria bacterium]
MRRRSKQLFRKYLVLIAIGLFAVIYFAMRVYSPVSSPVKFVVNSGDTVTAVASRLDKQKLVLSDMAFKFAIRFHGGAVQSGDYEIPVGASVWRIAGMLSRGKIATIKVVIPEGLTILQIKDLLAASSDLTGDVECSGIRDWGAVCDLADGDVFPDTYYVARGTSRLAVLDLARKKMQDIKNNWIRTRRNPPAPLRGWDDVITLASIVQRETPKTSEMKIVASVYLNRLRKGMRLQADPTVIYALTDGYGDMRGEPLLRGHLKIDSPYNTYRNAGLPPAPIANVGSHAIRAVLEPADTKYLYFVADGKGGHKFSNDYETHLKNHADWREIKKQNNPNIDFENNN